jgi:hypothetical protein
VNVALLVIGDGRGDFIARSVEAIAKHADYPFTARVMIDDSGDPEYAGHLEDAYPEFEIDHGGLRGMAGAVQHGFSLLDADAVLWVEEDMLLTRDLPLAEALAVLEQETFLAQMCFPRAACDPGEQGDQFAATVAKAAESHRAELYTWHDYLFSFQPCLIPRRVFGICADPCPVGSGIEDWLTGLLLRDRYRFGVWGHPGDAPYATHIGYGNRTMGYRW